MYEFHFSRHTTHSAFPSALDLFIINYFTKQASQKGNQERAVKLSDVLFSAPPKASCLDAASNLPFPSYSRLHIPSATFIYSNLRQKLARLRWSTSSAYPRLFVNEYMLSLTAPGLEPAATTTTTFDSVSSPVPQTQQHNYGTRTREHSRTLKPTSRLRQSPEPQPTITMQRKIKIVPKLHIPNTPLLSDPMATFPFPGVMLHPEDANSKVFLAIGRSFLSVVSTKFLCSVGWS